MKVLDLLAYQTRRWLVLRVDSATRLALLVNAQGTRVEVPDSLDTDSPAEAQVVANPAAEWPLVAFPTKRGTGPITVITLPGPVRNRDLEAWVDWVPADPVREGGALYFNSELNLRQGEVLLATFRNGTKGRITIPRSFGTVAQRQAPITQTFQPPEERTRFNRDRDVFGEDD